MRAVITAQGHVEVRWRQPGGRAHGGAGGIHFVIERRVRMRDGKAGGGKARPLAPMRLAGITAETVFIDADIPAGALGATYTIEPRRGKKAGEKSIAISVSFPGSARASGRAAVQETEAKLAA